MFVDAHHNTTEKGYWYKAKEYHKKGNRNVEIILVNFQKLYVFWTGRRMRYQLISVNTVHWVCKFHVIIITA